jgi:hypothetical protein
LAPPDDAPIAILNPDRSGVAFGVSLGVLIVAKFDGIPALFAEKDVDAHDCRPILEFRFTANPLIDRANARYA